MYVILYLSAIVLANLTVAVFGPGVVVLNAFLFIGLDLTARDRLHDTWRNRGLLPKMALLIAAGSLVSWLLNRAAGPVALASFVAFAAAASVDTLAYHLLGRYARWLRVNGSNIPSAAVDSLIFPTLAFGRFLWPVVLGQFVAKVAGGLVWSLILWRLLPSVGLPRHPWRPLEWLAGAFLDWRTERAALDSGLFPGETQADLTVNGITVRTAAAGVAIMADEAVGLLRHCGATNYVSFKMMPRADHGVRPVEVVVRWLDGATPAERAAQLEEQLTQALAELEAIKSFDGQAA